MRGKRTFERTDVVEYYEKYPAELQPPEHAFLNRFGDRLHSMAMLDIGVGAGRTVSYFAPRVKSYIGIDYSRGMIEACERKFAHEPNWRFAYGDARDLREFGEQSFDFVLFSFNGLDYVSHEDRFVVLSEIARVCKPGALFMFSTHNLRAARRLFRVRMNGGPLRLAKDVAECALRGVLNGAYLLKRRAEYATLIDGTHDRLLPTHYVLPEAQVGQLEAAGFQGVQIFSVRSGEEIVDRETLVANSEWWLYYLCTRST